MCETVSCCFEFCFFRGLGEIWTFGSVKTDQVTLNRGTHILALSDLSSVIIGWCRILKKRAFSMKITLVCPCMCKRDKTKCILVVLSLGGKIAKCGNFDPSWKWWFFPSTKTLFEHLSKCSIAWGKKNIPGGRRHVGATGWKYPSSELHLLDCNNTIYQEVLSCANKNQ